MTPRQMAFVSGKLAGLSNYAAVIGAGYSAAGAKQRATCLMKHPAIRETLQEAGFDLEAYRRAKASLFNRSAGSWAALAPSLPKLNYTCAIEFLTDSMNCGELPIELCMELATKLLPYQYKKL